MVAMAMGASKGNGDAARAEAPEFEKVIWYKDPNMRKLFFWSSILCVASATTGYDGLALSSTIRELANSHLA
jgi:hypothetical protein